MLGKVVAAGFCTSSIICVLFLFSHACSGSFWVLILVCGNCCTVVLAAHIDHSSACGFSGLATKEISDSLRSWSWRFL
jgi:hypothetical protein